MYNADSYEEAGLVGDFQFSEKSIRLGFIRKVYSILLLQLLVTLSFICLFLFEKNTQQYFQANPGWMIAAIILQFACLIAMACCKGVRRTFPTNVIMLSLFTVTMSFMLGVISSTYQVEEVLIAVGICAVVSLSLTLFAFQTKWDFTAMGGILFVCLIVLFLFGLLTIFIPSKVLTLLYGSLGALVFSVYLVFDTQMMMGGQHKYAISPEEYVFGALNLYLDIVNLFLYILTIVNAARK